MSRADEAAQDLLKTGNSLKRKVNALRLLSPFGAYLREKELLDLATACSISSVRSGKELDDSPFYVLISGCVAVKDVASGEVLCVKHQGSFFTRRVGLGQISDDTDLSLSTVVFGVERGKMLLVSSSFLLGQFYSGVSAIGQEAFLDICSSNIGTQLNSIPFIKEAALKARDVVQLGEMCSYLAVSPGTPIFEVGDEATSFYIILKGTVTATVNEKRLSFGQADDGAGEVESGVRSGGETFGIAAFVYNARTRTYGMYAKETTLMLVVSRDHFSTFLHKSPALRESLLTFTRAFLIQRHATSKHSIFHRTSPQMKEQIAACSKFVNYEAEDVVHRRGDQPLAFYIVAHGEVRMSYSESRSSLLDQERRPGQHFGEYGILLQNQPCLETVTCCEPTTLLVLEVDVFNMIFKSVIFELRVELLLKLQGRKCTLPIILHHRASHVALIQFASQRLGPNGLPVDIFNSIQDFSEKEAAARETVAQLRPITREMVEQYLRGELQEIVRAIGRLRLTRKSSSRGSATETLVHAMAELQELLAHAPARDMVASALPLLRSVETEFHTVLGHVWPDFVRSPAFEQVLLQIGAYENQAAKQVAPAVLDVIVQEAAQRSRDQRMRLHAIDWCG
jgi:CRP-like cAMP-binding protein